MQQLKINITRHVWRIVMAVMLLTGTQAYGQIAMGDTSGYSGTSNSSSSYSGYSGTSSSSSSSSSSYSGYSGSSGNSNYSNNSSNDNSVNMSSLTGLTGTSWSDTPSYNGNGVAGYAASSPSSLPSSSSSSCTGCYSGTASSSSSSGYNGNYKGDDSIDVGLLKRYTPSLGFLSGDAPSSNSMSVAMAAALNPDAVPKSNSFGSFNGTASLSPTFGLYTGRPFVGPIMPSDIYTPQQQLAARLAGDEVRAILGQYNTLSNEQKLAAQKFVEVADFVAGVSNQLPSGERTAVLDTIWDVGNVFYDAGKYVKGKLTGDQQLVDEAKIDFVLDTAAAAIPFVPAGITKVKRAADKAVEIGTIEVRTTSNATRLGGLPNEPAVKITYNDGTKFDMTSTRVKETEINPNNPSGKPSPVNYGEDAIDNSGNKRAPTAAESSWFNSITW